MVEKDPTSTRQLVLAYVEDTDGEEFKTSAVHNALPDHEPSLITFYLNELARSETGGLVRVGKGKYQFDPELKAEAVKRTFREVGRTKGGDVIIQDRDGNTFLATPA